VERWFDGASAESDAVDTHLARCPECAARVAQWRLLRDGAAAVGKRQAIGDGQFAAFIRGIHDRMGAPSRRYGGVWALVSITAAALIVAVAILLVLTNGPATVNATVVESCSSDIQGATVTSYASENGVTTVCVTVAEDDIW
jgi:anti-sigma factor RsiW